MDHDSTQDKAHEHFLRLFLQVERELLRYVMALVPNVSDARDVVQETAIALWQKFDQYDPERPFVAWASRFAMNEAKMFLRTKSRQKRLEDDVVDMLLARREKMADQLDARRSHLVSCLSELPKRQVELVRARYFDELSVTQLSERFGRGTEAIYKSLQRIRRGLERCIKYKTALDGGA